MRYSIVITLMAFFSFNASSYAEDPKLYDVCVIVAKGKTEVIKNKKGVDVEKLVKFHLLNKEGDYVVMARDGQTQVISIHNDSILPI